MTSREVREKARRAVEANPREFTPQMFTDVIEPFERHRRREGKITARLERRGPPKDASFRMRRLWERALARQHRHYEAAADLVLFLPAMRAELDPESRGGPSFQDPGEIEGNFLSASA